MQNQKNKKLRIISIVIVLAAAVLLTVSVFGADDTASDPLVSLSYLNGTYRTTILSQTESAIKQEATTLSEKLSAQIAAVKTQSAKTQTVQPTHTTVTITASSSYTAPAGSEFLFLSGQLTCGAATLTDSTLGERLNASDPLTANHLYVALSATTLQASENSQILISKP